MPIVRMPDGRQVRFPDEMPKAEIRNIIIKKYGQDAINRGAKSDATGYVETPGMIAKDVARSARTGGRSALEQMAGMFGDAREMTGQAVGWAAEQLGASPETAAMARQVGSRMSLVPFAPTTEQIRGTTNQAVGVPYEPQTDYGPYARTASEYAVGSAMPQGRGVQMAKTAAANALKYGVPAGLASEAAGQAVQNTEYAALEPVVRVGAGLIAPLSIATAESALPASKQVADTFAKQNVDDAARFGVNLSRGQATQNTAVKALEDAATGGGAGQRAQVVANEFAARQAEQVAEGGRNLARGMGPSTSDNAIDIASDIGAGARQRASQMSNEASQLYRQSEGLGASLDLDVVQRTLKPAINNYVERELGAPLAQFQNRDFDGAKDLFRVIDNTFSTAPAGSVAISVKGLDELRKTFTRAWRGAGNNPNGQRAIRAVMKGFDDWFDATIDAALVSGSEEALDTLKAARRAYAGWAKFAAPSGKLSDADRFVAKLLDPEMDMQPTDIAKAIWGMARIGESGQAVRAVKKLKQLFADDPNQWGLIKQGAINRAMGGADIGDPKGYGVIAKNLKRLVEGDGKAYAKELYTREELDLIRQFAKVLDTLTYQNAVRNPSNSGNRMLAFVLDKASAIGGAVGAAIGGIIGGGFSGVVGGAAAGAAAANTARNVAGRKAAKLFSEPLTYQRRGTYLPALAGTVTAADTQQ